MAVERWLRGMRRSGRGVRALVPLALPLVLLAGCGGGSNATGADTATTTAGSTVAGAPGSSLVATRLQVPSDVSGGSLSPAPTIDLPPGWRAQVWARLPNARFAAWSPEGALLVSSFHRGRVVAFVPRADRAARPRRQILATGLSLPQGLAFDTVGGHRVLYVAESHQIDRYVWNGPGRLGARTVVIRNLPDGFAGGDGDPHRPKSLIIGPGHEILVSIGSGTNALASGLQGNPQRATVVAYSSGGRLLRVVAKGARNAEGLSYAPDHTLWTAVNERDQIEYPFHRAYGGYADAFGQVIPAYVNEHPAEQVARLTQGRNLGWPYCDPDPDASPNRADPFADVPFTADAQTNPTGSKLDCAKLPPIERGLPAHSAPIGFHFLEGSTLPAPWRGGAVLAVHGSWDRVPPRAPAVLWLPWRANGKTLGPPVTIVGGFQAADGSRWGRPVDAVPGPDGALYVTDDSAGAVYRLTPPAS